MPATKRVVDLSDVKEGGAFRTKRIPAGDYRAKIVKADDHQPKDKGKAAGWVLTIQVEGHARYSYPYYLSPEKNQAWKIRQICVAAGLKVPTGRLNFDPNRLVNKAIGVAMDDDEYDGRPKSVIDDVFPVSEVGANADEDVVDDIEDDEIDTEEIPDDEEVEEDEPEEEPAPAPKRRTRKPAPEPEPEPEDDEDEDEEEPAPPPRRRKAAAPPAKKTARTKAPVDEDDDLDELDTDDLDD